MEQQQKHCWSCKENVLATRKGTNHVLHLLLSIVTVGWWLIIWIIVSIKGSSWMCPKCGSSL